MSTTQPYEDEWGAVIVVEPVLAAIVGQAERANEECGHLASRDMAVGAEPVVDRGIAPRGDSFSGYGLDVAFVDIAVVVVETPARWQGRSCGCWYENCNCHQEREAGSRIRCHDSMNVVGRIRCPL